MTEVKRVSRSTETSLELAPAELRELSAGVTNLVNDYFSEISQLPVFPDTHSGKTLDTIGRELHNEPESLDQLLMDCRAIIDNSRHNGHQRFFGYVASPSTAPGAFADLLSSALNVNVTSWRSGPAATEIERNVVSWLGSMIGFNGGGGLLTSGGSMANMTGLFMAHRAKAATDVHQKGLWNSARPMTLYASDQVHMSIPKAVDMFGWGREHLRIIETDENFRINVSALRDLIERDIENGFIPFCVVGNAGTVNTGAVDPLTELSEVAKEFGLWFHVDGAYGALAAVDPSKRPLFEGIDQADSLSLDPHKWLYVPIDCGCLLFRDETRAQAAFTHDEADYIKVHEQDADEAFAFWNFGQELSRRFRALKIWFTLRYYGRRRIERCIAEDNALAEYLANQISASSDFELLSPPELSICCFRYVPSELRGDDAQLDELNAKIMHAVQRGGDAYLSSATLRGKFALRACITNFRTTRDDLDKTIEIIREAARNIGH